MCEREWILNIQCHSLYNIFVCYISVFSRACLFVCEWVYTVSDENPCLSQTFELIGEILSINNVPYLILCIYRLPNSNTEIFLHDVEAYLSQCLKLKVVGNIEDSEKLYATIVLWITYYLFYLVTYNIIKYCFVALFLIIDIIISVKKIIY